MPWSPAAVAALWMALNSAGSRRPIAGSWTSNGDNAFPAGSDPFGLLAVGRPAHGEVYDQRGRQEDRAFGSNAHGNIPNGWEHADSDIVAVGQQ